MISKIRFNRLNADWVTSKMSNKLIVYLIRPSRNFLSCANMSKIADCAGGRHCRCSGWVACPELHGNQHAPVVTDCGLRLTLEMLGGSNARNNEAGPYLGGGSTNLVSPVPVVPIPPHAPSHSVTPTDRLEWPRAVFLGDDPKADALKAARCMKKEHRKANREWKRHQDMTMWDLRTKDPQNRHARAWFQRLEEERRLAAFQSARDRKSARTFGTTKRERQRAREDEGFQRMQDHLYGSEDDGM